MVGEDQSRDEEIDRIFLVASHRIRRKMVESIAEKGPRSFTELMDDAEVSDTGTMTFHLRKMVGFIRKNEKGAYELTELGWKAYRVIKGTGGKEIEERSEEKRPAQQIDASKAKPGPEGLPVVMKDMIRLVISRDLLEKIRSQGRRLVISDVVTVEVSDDVDPDLFDQVVERIRDVVTLRAPRSLLPIAQLKCREVLVITSRDRGGRGDITAPLGSIVASIPNLVSNIVSSVTESISSVLESVGVRVSEPQGYVVLKESFPGVKRISIDLSGGVVKMSHGAGDNVTVTIYERYRCRRCRHNVDLKGEELFIDISDSEAVIEIPETGIETIGLDASGGYIEIGVRKGVSMFRGDLSGSIATISLANMASSNIDLEVSGGKVSLDISYVEFAGESSLDLEVSGGILDLRASAPPTIKVESSISRTGGLARIDIDEKLSRVESTRGVLRVRGDIVGGLVNMFFKPGDSG